MSLAFVYLFALHTKELIHTSVYYERTVYFILLVNWLSNIIRAASLYLHPCPALTEGIQLDA